MYNNNNILIGKNFNEYINNLLKNPSLSNNHHKFQMQHDNIVNKSNIFFSLLKNIYTNYIEPNLFIVIFFILFSFFLIYRYNKKINSDINDKNNDNDDNNE